MKTSRKVFVVATIGMLIVSLALAHSLFGYMFIAFNPGILNIISKEINIEKLPVVQIGDTMLKVPNAYLTEIGSNEYVAIVPNDVANMKWSIRDKIKSMNEQLYGR